MILSRIPLYVCMLACLMTSTLLLDFSYGQQQASPVESSADERKGGPPEAVQSEPVMRSPGEQVPGKDASASVAAPDRTKSVPEVRDVFFAAGAVSPDGKSLFVVFDRYLLKYSLPELKRVQEAELGFQSAPITPSISFSPDGKQIYVVQNGMIFQIDEATLGITRTDKVGRHR